MNTIQIGKITRLLPSCWNELNGEQLVLVAGAFRDGLPLRDFKAKLLFHFLEVKSKLMLNISDEDCYYLAETMNFLVEKCDLTINLIRKIGRYHGPDDNLKDITFGEYIKISDAVDRYRKDKDEKWLDEMVATIYRPKKFCWFIRKYFTDSQDKRMKLIDRTLKKRISDFSSVDTDTKYAVYLFITGVMNSMPDLFPHVYKKKGSDEDGGGWIGVIISLADGKTDDESLNRVYNSNLYNVFFGLEESAKQYFKLRSDNPDLFKD